MYSQLSQVSTNQLIFTIKNYERKSGLSYRLHDDEDEHDYEIKGPMGKGLAPSTTGTHVAFAAGTGALCFVDLVAHVALAVLGLLEKVDDRVQEHVDLQSFQFVLYVSFQSREDAIGLELMEALHDWCVDKGLTCFKLVLRLSKGAAKKQPRWEADWIREQLAQYEGQDLQRVWVCGPPVLSETFDRTLTNLAKEGKLIQK